MADLLAAYSHTTDNRAEIESSRLCGCCSCTAIFPPEDIVAWSGIDVASFDDPEALTGGTALCPQCGREAVIGDKSGYRIEPGFLTSMNEAWFQRTIIRRPLPKP